MKNICICIVLVSAIAVNPVMAQKKKKKVKAQPVVQLSEEELIRQERIEQMTDATQKIMFIDSIVVDKDMFLGKYVISPESGTLCKYNDVFKSAGKPMSYLHINELGNKCYFSDKDETGTMKLYTSDRLGNQWTELAALMIMDSENELEQMNYPYIMADGTTLYFAAQGSGSIGGYDIFETRYDSETGTYLKPENIGMPFNSTANDYMYVIDETTGTGLFATDRNQPEGKVCVYTFIVPETRLVYSAEDYTEEQIKRFADITSIADTWGNGSERNNAISRLQKIRNGYEHKEKLKNRMSFVINDDITYTDISDFKVSANKEKYRQLNELKALAKTLSDKTEKAREQYAGGDTTVRNRLSNTILKNEKEGEKLEMQIRQLEKDIRNSENILLNQK